MTANATYEMLTTPEASALLGIKASTLTVWRSLGKGPDYVKMGGKVRYRRKDLDKYVESNVKRACQ